jgi:uncharacterized protein (TIGR03083 family)
MPGMDFVDAIERESEALAEAARRPGALAGAVPACPGWSGTDLVLHIGEVQAFWTAAARAGGVRPEEVPGAEPAGADLLEWYDQARAGLVKALREIPPDAPVSVWWQDGPDRALEVARRQAHEAAVHRWDAQSVTGAPDPIAPDLAADGVLEYCQRMLRRWDGGAWSGPAGVLRLAADDTGGQWLVRLDPQPALVPLADSEPLATVRGTACDLDLWLWRRSGSARVNGDRAAAEAFLAWAELG